MANETLTAVNKELRSLMDDITRNNHDPYLGRAVRAMVRLTNSQADNAEMDKSEADQKAAQSAEQKKALAAQIAALQKQADSL